MSRSRILFLVLIVILIMGAVLVATRKKGVPTAAATTETSRVTVAVARAHPEDLVSQLVISAEFRPYQEVEVHAKVAGYLKQISVDVGDRVSQGQVLATLEIPELADELAQAVAAAKRSEAQLLQAKEELERTKSTHAMSHLSYNRLATVIKTRPNLVAQQEIDEAQARDRVSEAQIASATAGITAAEQQVEASKASQQRVSTLSAYSRIVAPFAGVVTKRYADTGAMIQAGTASQTQAMPVVRISQTNRLRLVLPVPESIVPRIRIGESVQVRVESLKRDFTGTVARFTGKVQSSTRTMETEVDVANPGLILMPGMYASVILTLERKHNVLAIPVQAISGSENNPTVLLVNADKRIEERIVKRGTETPEKVQIVAGLDRGDLVVVGSRGQLRPGQEVEPKILEATASTGDSKGVR